MQRKTKWLLAAALAGVPVAGGLALFYLAKQHAAKIEPYIRDQAVAYLRDRFQAEVEMADLKIDIPPLSPVKLYVSKGRGVMAAVTGRGILLKKDSNQLLRIDTLRFDVDLGQIFEPHKGVTKVALDGVEIVVPPKGEGPKRSGGGGSGARSDVTIGEILITNAKLIISPKDKTRTPLEFALHQIRLTEAGLNGQMRYEAQLRNAKPPGEIAASGHFGPWEREEPGGTALDGTFTFEKADLGVFSAIGGTLRSTGQFQGKLNDVAAKGEATVPDFYLKASGNRLPLTVKYEVQVDGTNGDTILKPVHGRIGKTSFVTSGGIVKHDGDQRRTIALDVNMQAGRLEDVLLLAMKGGQPFMSGQLQMTSKVLLPPLGGKVIQKLQLNGQFVIKDAKFLRSQLQERIDKLSRQAQGQPTNTEIDQVVSGMSGKFALASERITLRDLAFGIPGADLKLDGTYSLADETVDFHGDLRVKAKLSETQTGWKRVILKPVDPFFAKNGAGLYSKIKITGTRQDPKFGREK